MGAQRNTSSEPQSGETINREDTLDENGVAWDIRFTFLLRPSGAFRVYGGRYPRLAPWATDFPPLRGSPGRKVAGLNLDSIMDGVASKNVCIVVGWQRRGTNQSSAGKNL